MSSFNEEYYNNNKQEKDRIGLFFYSNIVKNYFKPKVVLDYGCGTGFFLKRLSKISNIQIKLMLKLITILSLSVLFALTEC